MLGIFHVPVFADTEQTRQAKVLHAIAIAVMVMVTAFPVALLFIKPENTVRWLVLIVSMSSVVLAVLAASRAGYVRAGSIVLIAGLCIVALSFAFTAGGVRSPGIMGGCVIIVLFAGILLGTRAGGIVAAALSLGSLGLLYLEGMGLLPAPGVVHSELTWWLATMMFMGLAIAGMWAATGSIKNALDRARAELAVRTRTEQALRESESRYRTLSNASFEGISLSRNGVILDTNDQLAQMLGTEREQLLGKPVMDFVPPESHEIVRQALALGNAEAYEHLARRTDGTVFPVEVRAGTTVVGGHEMRVTVIHDMTFRKQAEQQRIELESQVQQAQRLESLGVLAGGVAHDFNNLLGAILGLSELAQLDASPTDAVQESLAEIRKVSLRARDLVQQILVFSRQQRQERHAIQLGDIVKDCAKMMRSTLPARIELVTNCAPGLPSVMADRTQIHQVIMNLCTNASHALGGNAGQISVSLEAVALGGEARSVHADLRPGGYLKISVSDTGKGMDAVTLARIFDPFFTTKAIGEGTGLGLAVVHGILKSHDGAIVVSSKPAAGSCFQLYFPAVPEEAEAASLEPAPLPRGGGQCVLYLDDEPALVRVATRILERLGYEAVGFTVAAEALAAVREAPARFDAIITDLNMPGMSGLDLAGELLRVRADLPLALISGYVTNELQTSAEAAGIRAVIHKPITTIELAQTVHRLVADRVRDQGTNIQ